jgi:hypothetical protein
MNCCHAA